MIDSSTPLDLCPSCRRQGVIEGTVGDHVYLFCQPCRVSWSHNVATAKPPVPPSPVTAERAMSPIVYLGILRLCATVGQAVCQGDVDARSPMGDALLDLVETLGIERHRPLLHGELPDGAQRWW